MYMNCKTWNGIVSEKIVDGGNWSFSEAKTGEKNIPNLFLLFRACTVKYTHWCSCISTFLLIFWSVSTLKFVFPLENILIVIWFKVLPFTIDNCFLGDTVVTESLKAEARIVEARKYLDFFHYFCAFYSCLRFQTFHDDCDMIQRLPFTIDNFFLGTLLGEKK